MGFEVKFFFYKKKTEGIGYDTEGQPEEMKVAVGKQWDDVSLDEVAKTIFGQMAKRNILIVDAEVYEYAKKKISFKLKDDGISIKNRKFSYDITGSIKSEEEESHVNNLQPHELIKSNGVAPPLQQIVPVKNVNQAIRFEIYDPHPDFLSTAKKLPFTIGKRYPIYEEKPDSRGVMYGMIYITEDDQGNRKTLNDKYFVPVQNLTNNFEAGRPNHISQSASGDNVVINGKGMNIPDIYTLGRRRE